MNGRSEDARLKNARRYVRVALLTATGLVAWSVAVVALAVFHVGVYDRYFNVWGLVDVAIFGLLTFGLYKRSLAASVGLVAFWVFNKTVQYASEGFSLDTFPFGVTLLLCFGVYGVWLERQALNARKSS